MDHCIRHAHAAHSVAFALPVLLLIRLPEAIAVGYKALAYRPPTAPKKLPEAIAVGSKALAYRLASAPKKFENV